MSAESIIPTRGYDCLRNLDTPVKASIRSVRSLQSRGDGRVLSEFRARVRLGNAMILKHFAGDLLEDFPATFLLLVVVIIAVVFVGNEGWRSLES